MDALDNKGRTVSLGDEILVHGEWIEIVQIKAGTGEAPKAFVTRGKELASFDLSTRLTREAPPYPRDCNGRRVFKGDEIFHENAWHQVEQIHESREGVAYAACAEYTIAGRDVIANLSMVVTREFGSNELPVRKFRTVAQHVLSVEPVGFGATIPEDEMEKDYVIQGPGTLVLHKSIDQTKPTPEDEFIAKCPAGIVAGSVTLGPPQLAGRSIAESRQVLRDGCQNHGTMPCPEGTFRDMATNTCVAAREARTPRFLTYVVQANDRLSDILAKHDVTLSTLLQCNPSLSRKVPGQPTSIDEPDFLRIATIGLHVGDMLMIPIPVDAEEHGEA